MGRYAPRMAYKIALAAAATIAGLVHRYFPKTERDRIRREEKQLALRD